MNRIAVNLLGTLNRGKVREVEMFVRSLLNHLGHFSALHYKVSLMT